MTPEEAKEKGEELKNSRDIFARRAGNYPEAQAALDFFYEEIKVEYKIKRADHEKDYRHHIRVFVLDIFYANQIDPVLYITFSRDKNAYRPGTKYHRMRLSERISTNVVDYLRFNEYIEYVPGFYDRATGISRLPKFRATEKFRSLLQDDFKVEIGMYIWDWDDTKPTVDLRDEDKKPLPYEKTEVTIRMEEDLKLINRTLEKYPILLHITDEEYWLMTTKMKRDANKGVADFTRKFVKRVFNNGSWTQGGRFYGGWWQNIPRECRQFIRIGDKDVVECDYSGLHINILYAMEKEVVPPGDVYSIPEYPTKSKVFRDFVKQLLLTIVNCDDRDSARQAIHDAVHHKKTLKLPEEIPSTKGDDIFPLLEAFSKRHHRIKKDFCSGKGIDLQYKDSVLAEQVMVHFSQMGYPILPMHDSFILHHGLEEELKDCMNSAFRDMFGTDISVDLKFNSIIERDKNTPTRDEDDPESHICDLTLSELFEEERDFRIYNTLLDQFRKYKQNSAE